MIQVTLSFPSAAEAASALGRLAGAAVVSTPPLSLSEMKVLLNAEPGRVAAVPAVEGFARGSTAIDPADAPDVGAAEHPVVHLPGLTPGKTVSADVAFNPFAAGTTEAAAAPVPPISAPVPPIVPAASTPPDRDSTGLPWDARIHAANRSTNQDGSWRQRRGLNDEALKNRVEQELRASVAAPAASSPAGSVASVAPPPAEPVVIPPAPPVAASLVPPAPPVAAPTAPPAAPTLPTPDSAGETFGQFMARMAPRFTADPARNTALMSQALSAVGLTTVAQLAPRPDLIATVSATFEALAAA